MAVALDVLHWRSEARLDHGAHFVPTLLDRPSFRSHVGGGEGDVQVLIVVHPGGFENIGKSRAGPLGGRYCPMLPRVLAWHRAHFEQFGAPVTGTSERRHHQVSANRVVNSSYVNSDALSTMPSTVNRPSSTGMSGNAP